jgi:DNA-directed RNA polymerase subunit N
MIIPVRCFSCGRPIGEEYENYRKQIARGEPPQKALKSLGIERYCCRRMFLSQDDLIETVALFKRV